MEPLVSICIACFNAERWISASLESVLAQTWPRCEIIVIDDGSTDGSVAIARSFEDRGVRVVTQPNAGQSSALNHALRLSHGELIKFVDADDLISPNAVELQVRALSNHPGSLAYGEWARFYTTPDEARFEPRVGWHNAAPVDWLVEIWRDGQPMMQCAQFLIPRALLERTGGWDERLSLINDLEFFPRLALASDGIIFTPGARLYYRSAVPGALSSRKTPVAWRSAALSTNLAVDHLLARENTTRTRIAGAAMLQQLVYDMYPASPELISKLELRIAELGGSDLAPLGGKSFHLCRRLLGWKLARHLQIRRGKWPKPVSP